MDGPSRLQAASDAMLRRLGSPGVRPVSLAYQEVQARYRLDDRFVIRSLDGRTDSRLLEDVADGNFDHVAYLTKRRVDFLMEVPNYNRDRARWSLQQLKKLGPGEGMTVGGLTFSRLPAGTDPALGMLKAEPVFHVTASGHAGAPIKARRDGEE
jgi:hypothetical protein